MLNRVKKMCKPDVMLYVDRMDASRDPMADLFPLRAITATFGTAIWYHSIVLLTNASKPPPDGADGRPIQYDLYERQRSQATYGTIRQAAGDMRLMMPVILAENHALCRRDSNGDRLLPNGVAWCRKLLLIATASKLLNDANALLKLSSAGSMAGPAVAQRRKQRGGVAMPWSLSQMMTQRKPRKPKYELAFDGYDRRSVKSQSELYNLIRDNVEIENEAAERRKEEADHRDGKPRAEPLAIPTDFEKSGSPSFDAEQRLYRFRTMNVHDDAVGRWLVQPISEQTVYDHETGMDIGVSVSKQGHPLGDRAPCHGLVQVRTVPFSCSLSYTQTDEKEEDHLISDRAVVVPEPSSAVSFTPTRPSHDARTGVEGEGGYASPHARG